MDFNNKIQQCLEESDSWKRILNFLQTENDHLKICLSDAVDHDLGIQFLGKAESLQHELIQKDELIALTKSSLAGFDECLNRPETAWQNCIQQILLKQGKIRERIEQIEQTFSRHKASFNDCLASKL